MRITDIRETAVALKSDLRNAVFDFSEMTTSVVAVMTQENRVGVTYLPTENLCRPGLLVGEPEG